MRRTRTNSLKDKRKENYYQGPEAFISRRPGVRLPSSPSFSRPPVDNMQINAKLSSQSFFCSECPPTSQGCSQNLHSANHHHRHHHDSQVVETLALESPCFTTFWDGSANRKLAGLHMPGIPRLQSCFFFWCVFFCTRGGATKSDRSQGKPDAMRHCSG